MKTCILAILLVVCSLELQAYSNFIENPYTLYPPGCATAPDLQTEIYGGNVHKFFEGRIPLNSASSPGETVAADVAAYRVACADANRSIIWLAFSIPDDVSPLTIYEVPKVRAHIDRSFGYQMSLLREPNTLGIGVEPWYYPQSFGGYDDWAGETGYDKNWIFVLDNDSPLVSYLSGLVSASQYNDSFELEIGWHDTSNGFFIDVPPTASLLEANPRIPLSGRLSGNWVVDGAPGQGFLLSVSELVGSVIPEHDEIQDLPLLMFLSWYTFDADGGLLWLTGAAQFAIGATEVTIPIERVTDGQFLGSKEPDREVVGSVIITGNNCNDLGFEYDLDDIGLGSGTKHLERLFSLETAGYACRDLEARIEEEGK